MSKGKQGVSMGGRVEESPRRKARQAKRRRSEEQGWAALSGPVVVRRVEPEDLRSGSDGGALPPSDS